MEAGARVLQLSLDRPDPDALGGLAVHAATLARFAPLGAEVLGAYPSAGHLFVEGNQGLVAALPLGKSPDDARGALAAAITGADIAVLHVHSPQFGADVIAGAVRETGVRLGVALHDHSLACENYELLEGGSRYCGIPMDLERCDRCLASTRGRAPGALVEWRRGMHRLVAVTDAIVTPSRAALDHAARIHPDVVGLARHIPWGIPAPAATRRHSATESEKLRVAIVGVWAKVKGADALPSLLAACRHLPVEWHLFGATEGAALGRVRRSAPRVVVHGAYRRARLAERLVRAGCHLVMLPSVGAETFSLTLSEVVAAGFPVLASHLGALGERVREQRSGWTFDPLFPDGFVRTLASLMGDRAQIERVAAHVRGLPRRTEEDMANEHAALWTELAARRLPAPGDTTGAIALFREGEARAASLRPSRFDALFAALKKTDFYRDLWLRRLVPENARRTVEAVLRRPTLGKKGRPRP